jgi:hypothetical protein
MKKIICIFLVILTLPFAAFTADNIAEIRTQSAVIKAADPVPELKFFPRKISAKDILIIIRYNNEAYVTSMNYTITAESVVLKGTFEGNSKEMDAYIDLSTGLKGLDPEKINVVVKDNTGRVIIDTDLPLVTLQ